MKAPRSVVHALASADGSTSARELLSVAIRIAPATGGKDGFFVQLFPDLRPPQSVYVTVPQLERLLALAESDASELEVWAELAKIPMEALAPARTLYPRLRTLLLDGAQVLRDEIATQHRRAEQRARAAEPRVETVHAEEAPTARTQHDPDAL